MDFIQKMLSVELPLTASQKFTYKSAFVAYFIVGLTMIIAPDLWNMVLQMDFGADGKGTSFSLDPVSLTLAYVL